MRIHPYSAAVNELAVPRRCGGHHPARYGLGWPRLVVPFSGVAMQRVHYLFELRRVASLVAGLPYRLRGACATR
jgi:hypothetical protein